MISYITDKGRMVYHYNPDTDDYENAEKEALRKHGLEGSKVTTIGVTPRTDFLGRENDNLMLK